MATIGRTKAGVKGGVWLAARIGAAAILIVVLSSLPAYRSGVNGPAADALDNGLALTPPMGWNSWYGFECDINQQLIRDIADGLVATGMRAAGYTYVNLDDCWAEGRKSDGTIVPDAVRFPDGIPALVDYVHARGLKFGLYTDAGPQTCGDRPGSLNHEQQDAETYAAWGVDFVKVDWCHHERLDAATQYVKFRDALATATAAYHHPIVFSIASEGLDRPWEWGPGTGNMWRTTDDVGMDRYRWQRMLEVLDENSRHAAVAGPGAWNDPDILQAGLGGLIVGPGGARGVGTMTEVEERAQFSMWVMMAAPLIAANDPRIMSDYTRRTLTNPDAIAIDQDPAGIQGRLAQQDGTGLLQVWSKPLQAPGARAVALFNRGMDPARITASWRDIGLGPGPAAVKDIWSGGPPATYADQYPAIVAPHSVTLLLIAGTP